MTGNGKGRPQRSHPEPLAGAPATAAPNGHPTVRDVAAAARVSVGVASVVLRDATSTIRVGPRTRERVRRAARQLGYTPNAAARALRTGRSNAIGVVVRQLRHHFFMAVIEGIDRACRAAGYHVLLGHVHGDEQEERAVLDLFARGRTDGLLILGEVPHDGAAIRAALARGIPTVLVARPAVAGAPAVTVDLETSMTLALDHLASLGHRVVALPQFPAALAMPTSGVRLAAAEAYARAAGWPSPLRFDSEQARAGQLGPWLRAALAADPPLTAVLASDLIAVGVLKAAHRAGIAVPERLSIVALDGTEVTGYTTPELTAVTPPLEQLGVTAAELLLQRLRTPPAGRAAPATTLHLPPAFTPRASTARAPRRDR
jgi:LacI family transcriptional regulator